MICTTLHSMNSQQYSVKKSVFFLILHKFLKITQFPTTPILYHNVRTVFSITGGRGGNRPYITPNLPCTPLSRTHLLLYKSRTLCNWWPSLLLNLGTVLSPLVLSAAIFRHPSFHSLLTSRELLQSHLNLEVTLV